MAGHSKFKNIQHRKNAQDKKRSKVFTKIIRDISTAARLGADPEYNPKLRVALIAARLVNLPKDRIAKAIEGANTENDNYVEVRYEGFGPSGVGFIVEAITDNKNRTAAEIRAIFSKAGGNLGETGSASFMFDRLGVIEYDHNSVNFDELEEYAIEIGAQDLTVDSNYKIYTSLEDYHKVLDLLHKKFGDPIASELAFIPNNTIKVSDQLVLEKINKLIEALDENDDVQNVFSNYEVVE